MLQLLRPVAWLLIVTLAAVPFRAARAESDLAVQEEPLPPEAEAELERLQPLVLPQQREGALRLMEKYPNTRLSRIIARLLDEYAAYDGLRKQELAVRDARTSVIREYWRARYAECPVPGPLPPSLRIVNDTDEPILFQAKLPDSVWMGPYRLRAGWEQIIHQPVTLRRITPDGLQFHSLVPGNEYIFRETEPGRLELVQQPFSAPAGPPAPAQGPPIMPPPAPPAQFPAAPDGQ
jgi:hypothetical protein